MAKPKHGRWNINRPSQTDAHPPSSPCPLPRSSRRPPSPAVLSALAVIAASPPVVAAGPLPLPTAPPTFLCPFFDPDCEHPPPDILSTSPQRAPTPSSSTTPPPSVPTPTSERQLVADKYVEGSDSLWRKTDVWTLYGSTVSPISTCLDSTANTSVVQSQPTTSQTPTPSSTPMPSSTLDTDEFDTSVLPAGWESASNITNTESTIILALAIVLAGSICVFMLTCLVWRKRKKKTRDLERKLAHKLADDDSQDVPREADARGKIRMWARATARWKSSIRQSARRRRKRPATAFTANRPLSPTFPESPQISVIASPRPSSFVSGVTSSSRPEAVVSHNGSTAELPAVLQNSRSPSPPTYGASFAPNLSRVPPTSAVSDLRMTPSSDCPALVQPSFIEDEPIPYAPPSDGHVATDDKAHLARIRERASSPRMVDASSAATIQPVSAPEWHQVEDDLEELGIDLSEGPIDFSLHPSFPPPPSKTDLLFGHLSDISLPCEEGLVSLPIPGPSRPPPEASPSAPPTDEPGLEPSAPSLESEDDLFQDWDGVPSYVPEVPISAELDSALASAKGSDTPSTAPLASHASFPFVRGPAAGDGILPQYHP